MLADLTKSVLTLLSSPAPGGGPRSQGLRAQQGCVSAAEGQPQTSLGVDGKIKKRQRIAPLHNQHICWGLLTRVGHKGWPIQVNRRRSEYGKRAVSPAQAHVIVYGDQSPPPRPAEKILEQPILRGSQH